MLPKANFCLHLQPCSLSCKIYIRSISDANISMQSKYQHSDFHRFAFKSLSLYICSFLGSLVALNESAKTVSVKRLRL